MASPGLAHAANATWTASSNGAWDTSSNWSTGSAASGSTSTATFGSATGTGISINTAVTIGTLQFNSGAPAYSLAVNSNASLTLGANGIVNNSSNPFSLTVNSSARVNFEGTSSAANSVLFLNSGGILDFSRSTGTITAGSIGGSTSSNIYLGARKLTVGSLNTSTLFQGIISDGGNSGGTGGSLTKVGTGTLTLDRDNTYTGITTISAGTLQIGNGGSTGSILGNIVDNSALVFNRGGTSTFAGGISGSGTVAKSGGGTVTLTGANTYTGGTFLNAGSLQVAADNNLGNASGGLTFNGGTLLFGSAFTSARSVTLTGAGTFNTSTFNPLLSGVVSGAGTLTKSGSGTLTLTGNNTYTGNTTVSAGTLQVGNGGTSGSFAGNVSVSNGAVLAFSRSDSQTYGGVISGSGSLSKLGTNTLTLTGNNTYNGGTTVNGTLIITGAHSGGGTATVNSGATLRIGNGGTTGSIASSIADNGSVVFNRSDSLSYSGVISGTGTLTKIGANTLTLTGNNTYGGATAVNAGTLVVTGNATGTGTTTIAESATLQIGNGGITGMLGGNIVDNGLLTFNRSDSFTFGGNISGTGSLIKYGAGTLTLTGTLSYTGTTSILGGALLIGTGGTTGGLEGDLVINNALTFNRADDYLYSWVISGPGSLNKLGAGTLTFTGANLYTGGTTITEGALQIGNGGTTGSIVGPVTLAGGALIFNRSDSVTFGSVISGTGTLVKRGGGTLELTGLNTFTGTTSVVAGTLKGTTQTLHGPIINNGAVYFDQNASGTYAGSISGSGSLAKQGSKLTLTGANTYTGATSFIGEVDLLGAGASINGTSGISLAPSASFANATFRVTDAAVLTPGALVVGETGTAWFYLSGSGTARTASAVLGANAGSNGNALITSNASTAWLNTGALVVGGSGTGSLTVENDATLEAGSIVLSQLAGSSGTLSIGLGASSATINTASVTGGAGNTGLVSFYSSDPAYTFAPVLAGNLRVEQRGSGTTTLTGANTYTGGTTLLAGKLSAVADSNLGATSGGLTFEGGTLEMKGFASSRGITLGTNGGTIDTSTATSALTGTIAGSGSLTVTGSGQLILTGANTYSGGTFVTNGKLYGSTSSLRGSIVNDTTVQFDQSSDGTFAGSMSGSGSLIAQGSRLIVTGVNTYTGATKIGGAIDVTGGVINGTSRIDVATTPSANASLSLSGPLSTVRTTGSLKVGQVGTGTLSVTGGSLLTSADSALGVSAGASGAALVSGSGSLWSNTGALTIGGSGSGTLTVRDSGVVAASSILLADAAGSSGVLNIGVGGDAGTVNTATISGGQGTASVVNFNHDESAYTVAAQLGGNLAVNQIGSGTTILTAANNYTGLTTISGGTLQIGDGGTSGSIVGDILNNGTLLFNRSDDFTFGGAISGTGSLIKDGAGTLTLTGSVTYSGTTTVLGGALLIGTGGTSGNWDGDLNINSTLTFNRSDSIVYSHVVSGTGSLIKTGTGTLTLTNANTYTGGTVISVGTLQIGNGGTTGSIVGNVTNNANLAFNRVDDVAFSGAITGTGTLTKLGAGTLTLTGSNTYGGGTSINAGILQVGDGGTNGNLTGNVSNTGALVFNRAGTMSYSGAISGSGTFSKVGSGTLNLTGNNTYTGATSLVGNVNVISGGRIEGTSGIAVAAGASQSGSLRVSGTSSRVTTAGTITVGGLGSGALTIDDGGTVNASNILLGAETGSTGVLNIGSGAAAGFLNATTVVDGAGVGSAVNLNFTDSGYTLGANLLHTLTVNQNGSGTTILTGVNSYTGGTHLNAGTLRVKSNSNLGGAASALYFNGGTLQWEATVTNLPRSIVLESGGGTIDTGSFNVTGTGVISGSGSLKKTGSGILSLTGANTYTGNLTVSAGTLRGNSTSLRGNILNNGAVEFLQTASGTYAGVMSGSGSLTKQNAGSLTLSGANTYTGNTTISSGTLNVSGSLASPVTVGASGALAGTGTINGNIAVSGVLAPGNAATAPFGTLTVNGNLSFASGSTLRVQTDELGNNSKINVIGATHGVAISGGTVEVLSGGGEYNPHTAYVVISAAGGVTGSFEHVTTDFAFLTPALTYDANHVNLTLDRNDLTFGAFAQTSAASTSAVAAAEYLDEVSGAEKLVNSITMLNATQASEALEDFSGSRLTNMTRVSMSNTAQLFEMLASRLGTQYAGSGLWVRQLATGSGATDRGAESSGVHTIVGLDAAVTSETTLGFSAIYTRDNVNLDDRHSLRSRVHTPQLAAYVNHSFDAAELRGVVGCGDHHYNTERVVAAGVGASLVSAQRSGHECSAYVQAEIQNGSALRPIAGLMYSRLAEPSYVERGGPAALAVDGHTTQSVLSQAGLRYAGSSSDERVSFEGRAVWSHEFAANDSSFRASLADPLADATDSHRFKVRDTERSRDSLILGAGLAAELRAGLSFHGDYNLQLDPRRQADHAFVASFQYVY
jgi:autotransporter-associated beta strand protein